MADVKVGGPAAVLLYGLMVVVGVNVGALAVNVNYSSCCFDIKSALLSSFSLSII